LREEITLALGNWRMMKIKRRESAVPESRRI